MVKSQKENLRTSMVNRRKLLSPAEVKEKSQIIGNILMERNEFKDAEKIFIYYSVRNEANTLDLIEKSLSMGKTIALPVVKKGNAMDFYRIESLSSLKKSSMGIPEPAENSEIILPDSNTLIIVPGTVFDRHKNRIGMGKGFYDRYFQRYSDINFRKIGICYDFQIVDELPCEIHDVPLDKIISEKGVIE